jgi:LysR family transcriptional regulator, benzoate and cis,cis-muconate-responsive activator of ben and cat genes
MKDRRNMNPLDGLELTKSFLAVADELSFRRGAERLNIDQSSLTRRIQKLETILGFALFERTTREVALTPAGRVFHEENARLQQSFMNSVSAARLVAEGKTGTVRLAYMTFAAPDLMPKAVTEYSRRYPQVDLRLSYLRTEGQKLALARDEVDLGYMIGPFDHSEYHSRTIRKEPLFVIAPLGHQLSDRDTVQPSALMDEEMIFGDLHEWEAYRWHVSRLLNSRGVGFRIGTEASNVLAMVGLVKAGLGITICPANLVGFFGSGTVALPIADNDFEIETVLAWKRANRARAVANFVEIASAKTGNL